MKAPSRPFPIRSPLCSGCEGLTCGDRHIRKDMEDEEVMMKNDNIVGVEYTVEVVEKSVQIFTWMINSTHEDRFQNNKIG